MAKRKGLPKKYAKMGFKKGWKKYKASLRTTRKSPTKRKPVKKRSVNRMARRKYHKKSKKSYKKSKSIFGLNTNDLIDVAVVGVSSGFVDNIISMSMNIIPMDLSAIPTSLIQAGGGLLLRKVVPNKFGAKRILKHYVKYKLTDASKNLIGGIAFGSTSEGGW